MERDILRIRQKPLKGEDGCRTFSVRIRDALDHCEIEEGTRNES